MTALQSLRARFTRKAVVMEPETVSAPLDKWHMDAETTAGLLKESERRREVLAAKRAAEKTTAERRAKDRRSGPFDRRQGERRQFATMDDKLRAESDKHDKDRRFTGALPSQFGGIDK